MGHLVLFSTNIKGNPHHIYSPEMGTVVTITTRPYNL
jgi:ribosomal protein L21E